MAGPFNGRYVSIAVNVGATLPNSTNKVEGLGRWSINIAHSEMATDEFGTVWGGMQNGIQKWSGSFSGMLKVSTAAGSTGQMHIINAALNQTLQQDIRFYLQSTEAASAASTDLLFWMPNCSTAITNYSTTAGCYISNPRWETDMNGIATAAYDIRGQGPLALFKGSSTAAIIS
jgi:hypothetical protein